MAKQSLRWTVLPNGYTKDKKSLRISLLLSPHLDPEADPELLESFPDFYSNTGDWPKTLAKAKFILHFANLAVVTVNGGDYLSKNRLDSHLGKLDSQVWRALFSGQTPVYGYEFNDPSKKKILSYEVTAIDSLIRDLYTGLATSAGDQLPTATQLFAAPGWTNLVQSVAAQDHQFMDHKTGLRDPKSQFAFFADGGYTAMPGVKRDLGLFELFHTPPSTPVVDKHNLPATDPRSRARWRGYTRTDLPKPDEFQKQIDFHKIVAAMGQYPGILRRLGLVVDLIIDRDEFPNAPDALLWAEVVLPSGVGTSPRTHTLLSANDFLPLPRPNPGSGDYRVAGGLLDFSTGQFQLIQVDPDGAMLKVMNFARTLYPMKPLVNKPLTDVAFDPVSKQERQLGAPAIRNAGLMLVHHQRSAMLQNSLKRQKDFNDVGEPDLYAEDLVRGYRVDIWDDTSQKWHSLCLRHSVYDFSSGQAVVDIPQEEGSVKLAATASPDPASNPELLWLHEALLSWTGWSLCVPPPGKTIHHHRDAIQAKDHTDVVGDAEAELPPGLNLTSQFKVIQGSLPRLRYGRKYWMRARTVDLAGNSLEPSPKDLASELPATHAQTYYRFEPILPPSLALVKPTPATVEAPREGESMERLAVRTFNDIPADNVIPSVQHARRFAVPSRTSVKEAEIHGLFDQAGKVDDSFFAILGARDNSLKKEQIPSVGPLDDTGPVDTDFAVMQEGEALPYLPDPLSHTIAARIFDLPGFSSDEIIKIPLYPGVSHWPDALPFKIELFEDPMMIPHFDDATRTLLIPLGKAERAVLRLSIFPTPEALKLLGVWSWLTPVQQAQLQDMALKGQHWMLTPWREINLVHAVQRPLITPEIQEIRISRPFAANHAVPTFISTCSIKSTDHLDLLAAWNDPSEDLTQPTGANIARTDHAFAVKITTPKSYASAHEYVLLSPDRIRAGGVIHDLAQKKLHHFNDTRYRRIEYHLEATTQFREYMPPSVLTEVVDGSPLPTDKNIKVVGPKTITWIPSSAPPPAPEVLYVVPTFGWTRTKGEEKQTSWRRGGGLRVYLNRPWNASGYGEMLAVVLPSAAFSGDPMEDPDSQPLKNFVTQWGNDPIWKSSFVPGVSPKRSHFPLARVAADPAGKWLPTFAPAEEAEQPPEPFPVANLPHPQILEAGNPQMQLEIAPHDVFYDPDRQLWYCDLEIDWGTSYYPFVRLALARYQPVSVSGAHLSHVVLADFMQLVPDRWLEVTRTANQGTRHVSLFGFTYSDSSSHQEAQNAPMASVKLLDGHFKLIQAPQVAPSSVVEVWVERLHPELGEDFGWQREPGAVVKSDSATPKPKTPKVTKKVARAKLAQARKLLQARNFAELTVQGLLDHLFITPTLWAGKVTLPETLDDSQHYRLAIAEYEEYLVDDSTPYNAIPTLKGRRLVFIEYVDLD